MLVTLMDNTECTFIGKPQYLAFFSLSLFRSTFRSLSPCLHPAPNFARTLSSAFSLALFEPCVKRAKRLSPMHCRLEVR